MQNSSSNDDGDTTPSQHAMPDTAMIHLEEEIKKVPNNATTTSIPATLPPHSGLTSKAAKILLSQEIEQVIAEVDQNTGSIMHMIFGSLLNVLMINGLFTTHYCPKFQLIHFSGVILFICFLLFDVVLMVACALKWAGITQVAGEHIRILIEAIVFTIVLFFYFLANFVRNWRNKKILLSILKSRYEQFKKRDKEFAGDKKI